MRTALFGLLLAFSTSVFADKYDGTLDLFESSPNVKPFFESAYAYAVFPTIGKGGIVLGGAYGTGRVYRNHKPVGEVKISEMSVGFQMGGQAFSEIIFLQDKRAFDEFTSGSFEFDASASAVAITAGVQAQAGTAGASASASGGPSTTSQAQYGYNKGMAVFVHALGGLMYEASIGGQKFRYKPLEEDVPADAI